MSNDLRHYGVKGQRWGVIRKKTGSSSRKTRSDPFGNNADVKKSITDSKAFKALVYNKDTSLFGKKGRTSFTTNELQSAKNAVKKAKGKVTLSPEQKKKAKAAFDKVSDHPLFKALVINKDTSLLTKTGRGNAKVELKRKLNKASESFNKYQVQSQLREIRIHESRGNTGYAKWLKEDLNATFTPDEIKNYSKGYS